MTPSASPWRVAATLLRVPLSLAVASTALAGHICGLRAFSWDALYPFFGVLLLSFAASALNQTQERRLDARMDRTRNRPLPSQRVTPRQALLTALFFGPAGALVLLLGAPAPAAILGLFSLLWYAAVYTPLKRVTPLAVLPGALTGAIPPLIGCTAAGGRLLGAGLLLSLFLFLWQLPHFLVLLLEYGPEYRRAGLPSLTSWMDERRLRALIFLLVLSTSGSTLLFPASGLLLDGSLTAALVVLDVLVAIYFLAALPAGAGGASGFQRARWVLYLFQVGVLALLVAGAVSG